MSPTVPSRRTGAAALAAGLLLFGSVAAELLWSVQSADGTVTAAAGFAVYLLLWTAGAAVLTAALLGLRPAARSKAGVVGAWLSAAGAALLAGFGMLVLGSALATGAPLEASFLLFALGLLLVGGGAVPLALGLRGGPLGGWWPAVLIAGAGALLALLAAADPWHDLGLFVCDAAWLALGLRLLGTARRPATV